MSAWMTRTFRPLFALMILLMVSGAALAQAPKHPPLAEYIPDDAVIYFGWRGTENLKDYPDTHFKQLLDSSQMGQVMDSVLPQLVEMLSKRDPNAAKALAVLGPVASSFWKHPTAFYFGKPDIAPGTFPVVSMGFLCKAGADAPILKAKLQDMVDAAVGSPFPIEVHQDNDMVLISVGSFQRGKLALMGVAKGNPAAENIYKLSESKTFMAARKEMVGDPWMMGYVDLEQFIKAIDALIRLDPNNPQQAPWQLFKKVTGLRGLQRFAFASGFDGRDWIDTAWLDAPSPRPGLLSLLDGPALSDRAMRSIPASASSATAFRFDLAGLISTARKAASELDANAAANIDNGIAQLKKVIQFDIEQDFLAALGDEWVIYNDPSLVGRGIAGYVLVNPLRDAEKVSQSMMKLTTLGNVAIAMAMRNPDVKVSVKQTEHAGVKISYLATPLVSPAWAIKDGQLYAGLYPQVVAAAISSPPAAGKSLADNKDFIQLRKRLGVDKISSLSWLDLPQTVDSGYQTLMVLSRTYMGLADLAGIDAPAMLIPPLRKIREHVSPAMAVSWTDDRGWHMKSISPFPGAVIVASDQTSLLLSSQFMLAGAVMPQLARARAATQQTFCGANLRSLYQAMFIHASNNAQKFPEDISVLVKAGTVDIKSLLCPAMPVNQPLPDTADAAAVKTFLEKHGAYVYLGAGKTTSAERDYILAYEKLDNHRFEGVNLLFADGSVQFVSVQKAAELLKKQGVKVEDL